MPENIVTVTDSDFDQVVIEGSRQTAVVVDFWAPWCGPCRVLTPLLEKLAQEYDGKFILAKVNADENPGLSQRYSIRSIPSMIAFVDGEAVDQVMGAQPEPAMRQFLDRIIPTLGEELRREAAQLRAEGNIEAALSALSKAAALEPSNELVLADLVETLLDLNRVEDARQAGARLRPLRARQPRVAQVLARLELAADPAQDDDAAVLETRIESHPDEMDARLRLAKLHARQQHYEQALEQLLEILKRDRTFGGDIARKTMVTLFDLLGNDHALVRRYRKELAAALY
jgi:putative thioredoxin